MTAFIVLTRDDKMGVLSPEIIGPFADDAEADAFLAHHPRWNGTDIEPVDGGYAGAVVVSATTATPPVEMREEWDEFR